MNESILNKKAYDLTRNKEIAQTILIAIGLFLVPLFIPAILQAVLGSTNVIASNSQIIVGSIVNTGLIMTAINIGGLKKLLLFASLPSISAIAGGYIFGPLSVVTVYMLPAIWIGNLSLILLVKYFFVGKKAKYVASLVTASLVKVAIIFGVLNMFMAITLIPSSGAVASTLRYSLGLFQIITVTVGAVISFGITKLLYSK
ncbi:MAG: hypothetical protein FWF46_06580 [Oscillospiraceae bacterium]|nr:hypothetical protein [Oscillospiraceae bacterium]